MHVYIGVKVYMNQTSSAALHEANKAAMIGSGRRKKKKEEGERKKKKEE